MTTDGGGFALIGRKTTPIIWTLPSNSTPVHPYGPPHWSSSLGEAPILDFRVQIGTRESLKSTRANWYVYISLFILVGFPITGRIKIITKIKPIKHVYAAHI